MTMIVNTGTPAALYVEVATLHQRYLARCCAVALIFRTIGDNRLIQTSALRRDPLRIPLSERIGTYCG
jgi:hypothetical protein